MRHIKLEKRLKINKNKRKHSYSAQVFLFNIILSREIFLRKSFIALLRMLKSLLPGLFASELDPDSTHTHTPTPTYIFFFPWIHEYWMLKHESYKPNVIITKAMFLEKLLHVSLGIILTELAMKEKMISLQGSDLQSTLACCWPESKSLESASCTFSHECWWYSIFLSRRTLESYKYFSFQLKFMWTIPSGFCLPLHIKPQDRQMVILPDSLDVGSALLRKVIRFHPYCCKIEWL